jgi:hypothetical protein
MSHPEHPAFSAVFGHAFGADGLCGTMECRIVAIGGLGVCKGGQIKVNQGESRLIKVEKFLPSSKRNGFL